MPYAWEWIDADGATRPVHVEYEVKGIFGPPVVLTEDEVPGESGTRVNEVRHGPREFALPLYERNDDPAALHQQLRDLVWAMEPTRGAGVLRATTPAGDQRELRCLVIAGLDMDQTFGRQATPTSQRLVPMFKASDPYWYAPSDVVTDFVIGTTASFFPIFPLRLTASELAVDTTVTNAGNVLAWPAWTITGPGSGVVLRNLTSGNEIALTGLELTASETVVIDTRPGHKTVTGGDGVNLWPYVSEESDLWSLQRGVNAIRLEMTGASSESSLRLAYRPRYLTV